MEKDRTLVNTCPVPRVPPGTVCMAVTDSHPVAGVTIIIVAEEDTPKIQIHGCSPIIHGGITAIPEDQIATAVVAAVVVVVVVVMHPLIP